jgi:ribosome biogenesis protein Tsr3
MFLVYHSLFAVHSASRGHSFFRTNAELLEAYSQCETAADVIAAQNAWLEEATAGEARKN